MSSSDLRLVIFDCDGTLVDSFAAIYEAMAAAFRDFGMLPPAEARLRAMIGLPVSRQVAKLLPDAGAEQWQALENAYRRHRTEKENPHEPMFPGARDCLDALDEAGILMAVATAKGMRGLSITLDLHRLRRYFVSLQTGDANPGKPNPGMVLNALRETGVDAARALVVGDTRFDIEMAINAGVTPVGVRWGYHGVEELADAGAAHIAADFPGLTETLLERLAS